MHIGERIKACRVSRNWTQEELARKLGYKSKSTINKIELGINDIPQSKVVQFAEVLGVTTGYLMGWVNQSASEKNNQLAQLVTRLRQDDDFFKVVSDLAALDEKQYRGIKQLLASLNE